MLALAMMVGCLGCDANDCAPDTAVTAATVDTDCYYPYFDVTGSAYDLLAETTPSSPENLCASLVDPTPVVDETGPLAYLVRDRPVGEDGSFGFYRLNTTSIIGLVMITDDCDDSTDNWAALGTGIPSDTVGAADYGDVLADQDAYVLSKESLASFEEDLALAGYAGGELTTEGYVMGVVIDSEDPATANRVSGATVSGDEALEVYYGDGDPDDGRFTTAGKPNTVTDASTNVGFFIPAGPIGNYTAADGANEYYELLGGSTDGIAMFIRVARITE